MTKTAFLAAYRARLTKMYPWTADGARLDRFMTSCADTISGQHDTWNHDGKAVRAAWSDIGGSGRPSLKALRALA